MRVERLNTLQEGHRQQQYRVQDEIRQFPARKDKPLERIAGLQADAETATAAFSGKDDWRMEIGGKVYEERAEAGKVVIEYGIPPAQPAPVQYLAWEMVRL